MHWTLRNFAEQLARQGIPCLRFDYSGTGDSWGTLANGTLGQWLFDIEVAAQELKDNAGVRRITLVGARFGALLAVEAARMVIAAKQLVLWDPVVSGKAYLHELRQLRDEKLKRWKCPRETCQRREGEEILGFVYPQQLLSEIEGLDLRRDLAMVKAPVAVYSSYESDEHEELRPLCQQYQVVDDAGDWSRVEEVERALLASALPSAMVERLVGRA